VDTRHDEDCVRKLLQELVSHGSQGRFARRYEQQQVVGSPRYVELKAGDGRAQVSKERCMHGIRAKDVQTDACSHPRANPEQSFF
jgi:hypothetical protein